MKTKNKGITLIALIITIIVLLILAGVTINALTGSDAAPEKANEVLESLEKKKALRNGFVEEIVIDKKTNIKVARYIE